MSQIDRGRTQSLLEAEGLDALVLFQPENFRYATSVAAGVATMWGRAGSAIALVPADKHAKLAAVISDHAFAGAAYLADKIDFRTHRIWIDMVTVTGAKTIDDINAAYRQTDNIGPRAETFDRDAAFRLLSDLLAERGLSAASIGVDLEFMPAADFARLKIALPAVKWRDASILVKRLRLIKNSREIGYLRNAAHYAESGLENMLNIAKRGASIETLSAAWLDGATKAAAQNDQALSGHWAYISTGPDLQDMKAELKEGDLVKADVGTLVNGYSSDGARTYVCVAPDPLASEIYKALQETFGIGLALLKPGNRFCDVHAAMLGSMRKCGFSEYYRGHFGHSVGAALGIEEWPFISSSNEMLIEPNMVLALETPFYANGLGALMIEEQFLITESGAESMNRLSRELMPIG
ncbi:M24 family metallopeptidase [Brucella rhizosphaerae]|uniref:Metallopeptidase M24 family protein n=2 Tax=Brucella rhizosphaerae TaxID=571254 RepID=A0A256FP57_9HYPH|nr:Xaa-Pro peptidase family protein [Brucella rhizosphaerae]OYR16617.1 metallopeptidase M24 family protein [Brucella rhizosphaerae]